MNKIGQIKLLLLIFVMLLPNILRADLTVIEDHDQYKRLRLQTPAIEIDESDSNAVIRAGDWPLALNGRHYRLPFYSATLQLEADRVSVHSTIVKSRTIPVKLPPAAEDIAIAPDSLKAEESPSLSISHAQDSLIQITPLGSYRGNKLWSLSIHPFRYIPESGELVINEIVDIELRVKSERGQVAKTAPDEAAVLNSFTSIFQGKKKIQRGSQPLAKKNLQKGLAKIYIVEEGFYRIRGSDLIKAGLNLLDIDIRNLRLTANGADVPIFVGGWQNGQFDENDYFEFWGEEVKKTFWDRAPDLYQDPYSSTNVYWLSWEQQGQWMSLEEGQVSEQDRYRMIRPYSFYETVHVERDGYFDRLSSVPIDLVRDFWFFDGGVRPGRKQDYTFELYHPDDQSPLPVLPKIMLCGRSMIDSVQHNVSAFLNDSYIGTGTWQWQNYYSLTADNQNQIFGSDLVHGTNQLTLVNNTPADLYDIFMLNWFEITYPRLYRAEKNFIKFTIPPNYSDGTFLFKVDGFTGKDIEVFKLGYSKITGTTIEEVTDFDDFTSIQVSFQDVVTSGKIEYVALTADARKSPFKIELSEGTDYRSENIKADYLLIAHPRFVDNPVLDELLNLRQAQGMSTFKANVVDVYDQFGYGRETPFALKNFINFAYENWGTRFILFVGDGCYIPNRVGRDTLNFIPAYMRQTLKFGSAASDHWYSLVDGDDEIPDVHIGRLPVRDNEQLTTYVTKLVANETNPAKGNWKNRILFIGGNGTIFREQAFWLQDHVPPKIESQFLFTIKVNQTQYDPYFGGTADLIDHFDQGCAVMTFHGHGGGAIWADNGLLRLEDSERLYNENRLPLILSMTCFTGSFESPGRESLADALLFDNEYGAMAMVGASGVGWLWNDYYLETEILKALVKRPSAPIGEIIGAGKIAYYSKFMGYHATSQINQYHLLGDPASRLAMPSKDIRLQLSEDILSPGDSVVVTGELPFGAGEIYLNIVDENRNIVRDYYLPVGDRTFSKEIELPEDMSTIEGYVQVYGEDAIGAANAHGYAPFSLNGVRFDSTGIINVSEDSLLFRLRLVSEIGVDRIYCIAYGDTLEMTAGEKDWYQSMRGVKMPWYGTEIFYRFVVETEEGNTLESPVFRHHVAGKIDIQAVPASLKMEGEEEVILTAQVYNSSDQVGRSVVVLFEEMLPDSTFRRIGTDTVDVDPFKKATAKTPFSPAPGNVTVRLNVEYPNDPFPYNNQIFSMLSVSRFNYSPEAGLLVSGAPVDSLSIGGLTIQSRPQLTDHRTVMSVLALGQVSIVEQPDLHWIDGAPVYKIYFGGGDEELTAPMEIVLRPSERSSFDSLGTTVALFQLDNRTKKWRRLSTVVDSDGYKASINRSGAVSLFRWDEVEPPTFEFSIDGQPYVPGRMVGRNPVISLLLQDANGVDLFSDSFRFLYDGKQMEREEMGLTDSLINANHVSLKLRPELDPVEHAFTFKAADCFGNATEEIELLVNVQANFEINMLGNYPNPFLEETVFAYEITQPCEEVTLRIYTASGRLIRNMNAFEFSQDPNPLSADYHELLWDGRDQDGMEVANGVYFYKLTAKQKDKSKEVLGKVAKIK